MSDVSPQDSPATAPVANAATPRAEPSPAPVPGAAGGFTWLIASHAVKMVHDSGDDGAALADRFFDSSHTYLIGGSYSAGLPNGWRSTVAAKFTSYKDMETALFNGSLDRTVSAVLYDNEAWRFTPPEEQRQSAMFEMKAADLAHQHHLLFVAAPAVDLVKVLEPKQVDLYSKYLSLGIAREAAKHADVIDIQSQGTERDERAFAEFVKAAAAQAREGNPAIKVLAGLSTNPRGEAADPHMLLREVAATHSVVDGYWLNIPGKSQCPDCGAPRPDIAVDLLKQLAGTPL